MPRRKGGTDPAAPPPIEKPLEVDSLAQVKEILARQNLAEIDDFGNALQRILAKLQNWELISEKKLENTCEALRLVNQSKGYRAIGFFNHY
jgi:hypothetical protein